MTDETDEKQQSDEDKDQSDVDARLEKTKDKEGRVSDAETAFEEYASDNECPECGEPIVDVRANCPNCGYEYQESDYGDKEAGQEFIAGSAVDDEGEEIPDDPSATGEQEESDQEESEGDDGSDDEK